MSEPPNDADPADSSSSPTESRTSAETCGIDALRERLARLKGEASCVAETSNDSWSSQPISSTAVSLLDCKLPSPPPKSPEGPQPTSSGSDFRDANPECVSRVYQRATSHPVGSRETGQPQDEFPGARSLSPSNMDPYTWSCTWVDLPSPFGKVETQLLIPPLQVNSRRRGEGKGWNDAILGSVQWVSQLMRTFHGLTLRSRGNWDLLSWMLGTGHWQSRGDYVTDWYIVAEMTSSFQDWQI